MPLRTAVVTGANKGLSIQEEHICAQPFFPRPLRSLTPLSSRSAGIGLAIVRALALRYPTSALHAASPGAPLNIFLTARSPSRGAAAVASLHADEALSASKVLRKDGGLVTIEFAQLDVDPKQQSISEFALQLKDRFASEGGAGGLDILVNNAAMASDAQSA